MDLCRRYCVEAVLGTMIVLVGIAASGIIAIDLTYPGLDNDPLRAPLQVIAVTSHRLRLADGRTFDVDPDMYSDIVQSDFRVDVETGSERGEVTFFVKKRGSGSRSCAPPPRPILKIPVISTKDNANYRAFAGFGRLR